MDIHIENNYGSYIENKAGGVINISQESSGRWRVDSKQVDDAEVITEEIGEMKELKQGNAAEEIFHFIHPEIEDEEAWRIHYAIKRLVAHQRLPEICSYLKELKQKGKVLLPSVSSIMYNELVRLGMPKGEGYTEKHFSNNYTK